MLTSKQRAYLRAMANDIQPIFQIGKLEIGDNLGGELLAALEARELIKISVLQSVDTPARAICDSLVSLTGAEPVQCIGRRIVLYKPSKENKKIELPR
jgi:RNA-binding protein